ncbi:hypothetical protein [Parabacteroides sp. PF5-6]|uniref:hypothetical protein n=1 Tax=Parabacteroides sp. PF5-6 TaxID=1742403 RepID=UPI0024062D2A|nr:hypothetical protein [Parabacteroides sp. PF5-6]MDF9830029.1 sRNA-binding regulator protein Hfq [Parabacteroides sp. PF5-6]
MRGAFLLLIVLFSFNSALFSQNKAQETIYLKNGSVIKGSVIEQVPNQSIKVQTADGSIFVYKMEEVEKITKEEVLARYKTRNPNSYFSKKYDITGYRGFIDGGFTKSSLVDGIFDIYELSTSHGYQFSPYLFIGAGAGTQIYRAAGVSKHYTEHTHTAIPVFLDIRTNFMKGSIVPFLGVKAGYSFLISKNETYRETGFHIIPSLGVKFMISAKCAANLSLGYLYQVAEFHYQDSSYSDGTTNWVGGINCKLGFEF